MTRGRRRELERRAAREGWVDARGELHVPEQPDYRGGGSVAGSVTGSEGAEGPRLTSLASLLPGGGPRAGSEGGIGEDLYSTPDAGAAGDVDVAAAAALGMSHVAEEVEEEGEEDVDTEGDDGDSEADTEGEAGLGAEVQRLRRKDVVTKKTHPQLSKKQRKKLRKKLAKAEKQREAEAEAGAEAGRRESALVRASLGAVPPLPGYAAAEALTGPAKEAAGPKAGGGGAGVEALLDTLFASPAKTSTSTSAVTQPLPPAPPPDPRQQQGRPLPRARERSREQLFRPSPEAGVGVGAAADTQAAPAAAAEEFKQGLGDRGSGGADSATAFADKSSLKTTTATQPAPPLPPLAPALYGAQREAAAQQPAPPFYATATTTAAAPRVRFGDLEQGLGRGAGRGRAGKGPSWVGYQAEARGAWEDRYVDSDI
jgi:hypothetical protein